MHLAADMQAMGRAARKASRRIAAASTADKSRALRAISAALHERRAALLEANAKDLIRAGENGLAAPLRARLRLDQPTLERMIQGIAQVDARADPVGQISAVRRQASGIAVGQMRVPLGVIGIIYESRPNVTVDAAVLCIKSGNAVILRGGSEAFESNRAICTCIAIGLARVGLPKTVVQYVHTADRAAVGELVRMVEYVDLIVPRGGKGLIERLQKESRIPMLKHLHGVCHVYIDAEAARSKAIAIAVNSKVENTATCNAMETLLIAQSIAPDVLPELASIFRSQGVELRGCPGFLALVPDATEATEVDWRTEYLGPTLAVRIVANVDEAIAHINTYGSQHTDTIVSENYTHIMQFLRAVDSASVLANASTQFADGFEFGLGAEMGISTDKLHARGPVGLEGLTTQKFIVFGHGEIRKRGGTPPD